MTDPRRSLPSVDRLLQLPGVAALVARQSRASVTGAIRELLAAVRSGRQSPPDDWEAAVAEVAERRDRASLRPVINASGVVLHTNLGRAPLAPAALAAVMEVARGYSTLEYDLPSGARGSRHDHCGPALAALTGAEAALVVNNAAGALVLALQTLAAGREVIISRGELVEIGGSFRIPDILARSGATLREVGTTNRTHLADYAAAIGPATGAVLTVHRSNFEQRGFVTSPPPAELAALARERGVPYLHDVGSGLLLDLASFGLTGEPRVPDAVAQGADLVIFSGDKLLGGPQAGCLAGRGALVAACRANPLARAMRADKLTLAALEATLALSAEPPRALREIPVLRMLTLDPETLAHRARDLCDLLRQAAAGRVELELLPGVSTPGGGSFPGAELPTTLVAIDPGPAGADSLALRLRLADPPVVARVHSGRVLFDPRTLADSEHAAVAQALAQALTEPA